MGDGWIETIFIEIKIMQQLLQELGISQQNSGASTGTNWLNTNGKVLSSLSPVDGKEIATVNLCDEASYERILSSAQQAFLE